MSAPRPIAGARSGPSIALVVDHPQRDLAGLTLVAHELCQRGATCHLVPLNLQRAEVFSLAPDFVVLNYLRGFNEPFVRLLRQARVPYGLLDTEGAVFSSPAEYAELHCRDGSLLHGARCACLWGPVLGDYLVSHGHYRAEQLSITGCPRFDFYSPLWRAAMWGEHCVPDPARPRILLNTNFSIVNPRFTTSAESVAVYHRELGWSHQQLDIFTRRELAGIDEMIRIAKTLAEAYRGATIVVRPHPHESPAPYRNALAGIANIELSTSGPVQPEIFRASVVVQRSCTTAIEASLAGVPTISPHWIVPPMEAPMADAVGIACSDMGEVRSVIDQILAGRYTPPPELVERTSKVVGDWFHSTDGMSFRRVVDTVMTAVPKRDVDEQACAAFAHGLGDGIIGGSAPERIARRVRHALGLSPNFSFRRLRSEPPDYWPRSDKSFTELGVRELLARIDSVYRGQGWPARPVTVSPARYSYAPFVGYSLTLSAAA